MNEWRIEVHPIETERGFLDPGWNNLKRALPIKTYWIEAVDQIHEAVLNKVFVDSILEKLIIKESNEDNGEQVFEVSYRRGVTDNPGKAASEALGLVTGEKFPVRSGTSYYLWGDLNSESMNQFAQPEWFNPLIHQTDFYQITDKRFQSRFLAKNIPQVKVKPFDLFTEVSLSNDLDQINQDNNWSFYHEDLLAIKAHYQIKNPSRQKEGLGDGPTDVELEVLAQTWSEHCKHRIFAAEIDYQGEKIDSLYKSYIQRSTKEIQKKKEWPKLVSVFSDNAGVVRYQNGIDLALKVETHNSPSALDPYGGALTGILGVNRDILGVGLGAKPIANMDVFCVAPPTQKELPIGLKAPQDILKGIHKGVEDGGNKSGIPTVNGAIYFHQNYVGKPLVYCGTLGLMPAKLKSGRETAGKYAQSGDLIVMAGGRVGKDGIHGATFSSRELKEKEEASVVQIGDPLTQKRLLDFTIAARDAEVFSAVTDNGAGGLSSSVGEMAELTNGAKLELDKVLLKYPGLKPYEILISESQERMTYAVPPKDRAKFVNLANQYGVEFCFIGEFNQSGHFHVTYENTTVAYLDLEFLHGGAPQLKLTAKLDPNWRPQLAGQFFEGHKTEERDLKLNLLRVLAHPNVKSKEEWVRQYDHEVQASTIVKPFSGKRKKTPQNSGVLKLDNRGGNPMTAVVMSSGLCPSVGLYDPYLMGQMSVDEAVRNAVAVGADPNSLTLVDNFCWPDPLESPSNPDAQHKLAQLVEVNRALYEMALAYGAPFISGKDSMKNDYKGRLKDGSEIKISVPATILITCMSYIPNTNKIVQSGFKKLDDLVYIVGDLGSGLVGSAYFDIVRGDSTLPQFHRENNFELYHKLHQAMQSELIQSCHDISDGGALTAISECLMEGDFGLNIEELSEEILFSEQAGRFIVSIAPENQEEFELMISDHHYLGYLEESEVLKVGQTTWGVDELEEAWLGGKK